MRKLAQNIGYLLLLLSLTVSKTYAQVGIKDTAIGKSGAIPQYLPQIGKDATTAERSLGIILEKFAGILFMFAGAVAIYFILDAGFNMMKARGDEEGLTKAKQQLMWSLLGFLPVILAYTLVVNLTDIIYQVVDNTVNTAAQ